MTTDTLVKPERSTRPDGDMLRSFFGSSPFGSFFREFSWLDNSLMNRTRSDDGSVILEYNLAGFEPEDIHVKFDSISGELIIKAENEEKSRRFSNVMTLPQYASEEDITWKYENGVLILTIAPLEKRKEDALVEIPMKTE